MSPTAEEVIRDSSGTGSPARGWHSIERVFDTVRASLGTALRFPVVSLSDSRAHALFWLPLGIWRARRLRADLMHVVGDIHYVALALSGARTILTVHDLNRLDKPPRPPQTPVPLALLLLAH